MAEEEEYAKSLNALGLSPNKDPYPTSSPDTVNYWADNKKVLSKLVETQIDSSMFASSALYVFWGPTGVGKTFAANFLASPSITGIIAKKMEGEQKFEPGVILVRAPVPRRTGELTFGVHKEVVQALLNEICREEELLKKLGAAYKEMSVGVARSAFKEIGSKVSVTLSGNTSLSDIESSEGFKYLIGDKSKLGKLSDVNDMVAITKTLANLALQKYTRLLILIDELETLSRTSSTERLLFSDYMRRVHDDIQSGMTWIMIFTFDSAQSVLEVLQPALVSRVRETIAFEYVQRAQEVKEYISECWQLRSGKAISTAFDSDVITMIADRLHSKNRSDLSFRKINIEMHATIARCYSVAGSPKKFRIDAKLYQKSFVSASDVLKEIKDGL